MFGYSPNPSRRNIPFPLPRNQMSLFPNCRLSALLIVVLLPIAVHGFPSSTSISYTFELRCVNPNATKWCAEIYLFEEEGDRSFNDPWWYGSLCTNKTIFKMSTSSLDPLGDGLIFDEHYEPRWLIYHNCTNRVLPSLYENCFLNDKMCLIKWPFWFNGYKRWRTPMYNHVLRSKRRIPIKCECLVSEPRRMYYDTIWEKQVYETPTLGLPNTTLHAYRDPECEYPYGFADYFVKPPCTWGDWEFEHTESYTRRFVRKNGIANYWKLLKTYFWDDPIDVYSTDSPDKFEERRRAHQEKMRNRRLEERKHDKQKKKRRGRVTP